ncbi:hypothetical protein [Fibrivirga algicola]|uniref:Uncharacterized protein n=1 Tax=Fibrivirga algicola TaxID=2950420 RepID=A0ABX0QNS2_9BACT|nr:hypothetical protein [Fibrivirga algicola]NID12921.1 hypothetical protein [Fibrivirga algicola]
MAPCSDRNTALLLKKSTYSWEVGLANLVPAGKDIQVRLSSGYTLSGPAKHIVVLVPAAVGAMGASQLHRQALYS